MTTTTTPAATNPAATNPQQVSTGVVVRRLAGYGLALAVGLPVLAGPWLLLLTRNNTSAVAGLGVVAFDLVMVAGFVACTVATGRNQP